MAKQHGPYVIEGTFNGFIFYKNAQGYFMRCTPAMKKKTSPEILAALQKAIEEAHASKAVKRIR